MLNASVNPLAVGVQVKMLGSWGQRREVMDPGTHQSMAGTEGCSADSGALLQNHAPEMAGGARGSHHLNMGEVPVSPLHEVAFGKKSPIDRQVKKQVLLLVWNSVVHSVLWAIQVSLPPAAGEGVVQAIGQKVTAGIYLDRGHHVVFGQGLEDMLCKKRRHRMKLSEIPAESIARQGIPVWNLDVSFQNVDCETPLLTWRFTVPSTTPMLLTWNCLNWHRTPSSTTCGLLSWHQSIALHVRCFPKDKWRRELIHKEGCSEEGRISVMNRNISN